MSNNEVQLYARSETKQGAQTDVGSASLIDLKGRVTALFQSIIAVRKDIDSIIMLLDNNMIVTSQQGDEVNPFAERGLNLSPVPASGLLPAALSSSHVQDLVADKYPWVITLSREVQDAVSHKRFGTLLVDLNYGVIEGLCSDIQLGRSGYVFIINQSGEIVYHPRQQLIYSGLKDERIDLVRRTPNGHLTANVDGREVLYTTKTSKYTGWTVVGVSYLNELFYSRSELAYYFAMIAVFCFFALVIVSSLISRRISEPISALRRSIQAVERGNFDVDVAMSSTEEVNELARDFDIAIRKIKDLIAQNATAQEQKRKHELEALQAQINPHFLHNTLDSIIWMIECGDSEDAIEMTATLARFFRLGISKGGEIITVQSEIEHLNCYLKIQKMRYKDKLDFQIDVDPDLLNSRTLKLLIQPLVENAIYHGIKSQDRIGNLRVTGCRQGDDIVFRVIDNGAGMTSEELADLDNARPSVNALSGIGVMNVRERIHLYFGPEYGIVFESKKGHGTTAIIRLPANFGSET
jgi:two-component system sensor histidine kinase YesM